MQQLFYKTTIIFKNNRLNKQPIANFRMFTLLNEK